MKRNKTKEENEMRHDKRKREVEGMDSIRKGRKEEIARK